MSCRLLFAFLFLCASGCKSDECEAAEVEAIDVVKELKPMELTPDSLRTAATRFRGYAKKSASDDLRRECESFATTLTGAATGLESAKGEQMKVRKRKEAQQAVEDGSNKVKAVAAADIEELCS